LLASFKAEHVRSIEQAELALGPRVNLIVGANGAGKTSLLESIYLLGRGRSFRTRLNEKLIRHGADYLRVLGQVPGDGFPSLIGLEVSRKAGTTARINAETPGSLAELATAFPVQVIDPEVHKLVEEGASRRRRWLDWAVFHVEPAFGRDWARYQRALQQRNAALRSGQDALGSWDAELVRAGEALTAARERVVQGLARYWSPLCAELAGVDLSIHFYPGWDTELGLDQALATARDRDRDRRTSTTGPHRADLRLRCHGRLARETLSRGQQKLTAVALTLAQLMFLKEQRGIAPTLLLDDPAAELDTVRLGGFIQQVMRLETQLVITSLQPDFALFGKPEQVFHVEHGRVKTL
jgi:DNA replication and repair protein RecF